MSLAHQTDDPPTALVNGLVACPAAELPPGGRGVFIRARDGAKLRVATWPAAFARASVIIMPGRTEFIEKFGEVIGELLRRGLAVGVIDWRSQGLSQRMTADPLRGHISDFKIHVEDFAEMAAGPFSGLPKPWIFLAHSMGANIAFLILKRIPGMAAAAAFTAPLFGILTGAIPMPLARLIAASTLVGLGTRYVPGGTTLTLLEETFAQQVVTHDERRYARAHAIVEVEPRLALAAPTIAFAKAVMAACDEIASPGAPEGLDLPILLALAGEELVIDNARTRQIAPRLPHARLVEFTGARHEILMEKDAVRGKFWAEFDVFVASAVPTLGRPASGGAV
jgi:lysophospholipase